MGNNAGTQETFISSRPPSQMSSEAESSICDFEDFIEDVAVFVESFDTAVYRMQLARDYIKEFNMTADAFETLYWPLIREKIIKNHSFEVRAKHGNSRGHEDDADIRIYTNSEMREQLAYFRGNTTDFLLTAGLLNILSDKGKTEWQLSDIEKRKAIAEWKKAFEARMRWAKRKLTKALFCAEVRILFCCYITSALH